MKEVVSTQLKGLFLVVNLKVKDQRRCSKSVAQFGCLAPTLSKKSVAPFLWKSFVVYVLGNFGEREKEDFFHLLVRCTLSLLNQYGPMTFTLVRLRID